MARVQVTLLCNPLLLCELGVELVDEDRVLPRHDGVGVTLEDEHLGHSSVINDPQIPLLFDLYDKHTWSL